MEKNLAKHEAMIAKLEASMYKRMEHAEENMRRLDASNKDLNNKIETMRKDYEISIAVMRRELDKDLKERDEKFELKFQLMEAKMDASVAKYEASSNEIIGEIKAINAKFDTLQNRFAWNLAWVAIVIPVIMTIIQRIWR